MFNLILDRLPTEYEGYLIRTSFRIGMQICLCLSDDDLDEEEKTLVALNLLYGRGLPEDPKVAVEGLRWFLSAGADKDENKASGNKKELFYWDFDSSRIYSSFRQTYGIDLATEDMHWFKFISMIGSLDKDSALSSAMQIRDYDMSDMKGKARANMEKLKRELTPPVKYTAEEQEQLDKFNALLGGDVNG